LILKPSKPYSFCFTTYPWKKLKLKEHSKVIIKIIDEEEIEKILDSMIIEKVEGIDYKKLKETHYESL